jgi:hypothetical protein
VKNAPNTKPSLRGHLLHHWYASLSCPNNTFTAQSYISYSRCIHNRPLPLGLRPPTTNGQRPTRCNQTTNTTGTTLAQRPNTLRRLSTAISIVRRQHRKQKPRRLPKVHENRRCRHKRGLEATGTCTAGTDTPRCLQFNHGVRRITQDEEPSKESAVVSQVVGGGERSC